MTFVAHATLSGRYWRHFCKLVYCVRRIHQHSITQDQLLEINTLLKSFVVEYEELYYQRRSDRLHFVRQSIHALLHIPGEVPRMAMPAYYSQWSMERTIGDLGSQIKQPSNPYANLSQRGVLRCQINSLSAIVPGIVPERTANPRGAEQLGDSYILLRAKDKLARKMSGATSAAIRTFFSRAENKEIQRDIPVVRWARLGLPNGQILRSAWKEDGQTPLRMSRIGKVSEQLLDRKYGLTGVTSELQVEIGGVQHIAEVKFYFRGRVRGEAKTLALVSCFGRPNMELLEASYKTLYVCKYQGDDGLEVVDAKTIQSVVAMVPFHELGSPHSGEGQLLQGYKYFLVEKFGLEMAYMGGSEDDLSGE